MYLLSCTIFFHYACEICVALFRTVKTMQTSAIFIEVEELHGKAGVKYLSASLQRIRPRPD